jgi:hypothetical protein
MLRRIITKASKVPGVKQTGLDEIFKVRTPLQGSQNNFRPKPPPVPGRATCPRPAVFNSLETAGVVEILLMIGYEKPTDIYS